jgi:hypothetical protein
VYRPSFFQCVHLLFLIFVSHFSFFNFFFFFSFYFLPTLSFRKLIRKLVGQSRNRTGKVSHSLSIYYLLSIIKRRRESGRGYRVGGPIGRRVWARVRDLAAFLFVHLYPPYAFKNQKKKRLLLEMVRCVSSKRAITIEGMTPFQRKNNHLRRAILRNWCLPPSKLVNSIFLHHMTKNVIIREKKKKRERVDVV